MLDCKNSQNPYMIKGKCIYAFCDYFLTADIRLQKRSNSHDNGGGNTLINFARGMEILAKNMGIAEARMNKYFVSQMKVR